MIRVLILKFYNNTFSDPLLLFIIEKIPPFFMNMVCFNKKFKYLSIEEIIEINNQVLTETNELDTFIAINHDLKNPLQAQEAFSTHLIKQIKKSGFDYAANLYRGNIDYHTPKALRHHNMEWITSGALDFLDENKDNPFFLYFSTHDIHVPRVPNDRFVGKTDMGPRGDAIDRAAGRAVPRAPVRSRWRGCRCRTRAG